MNRRTLIPLLFVGALVLLLGAGLRKNPRVLPSVLIDRPAPAFTLPSLHGQPPRLSEQDLRGGVTLLNVWASWCVGCRTEHALLESLAGDGRLRLIGMNYKDREEDARRWLSYYGNPYRAVAVDAQGRVGMDYGVYGVPETFVIDSAGVIRLRHVGPLDERALRQDILPLVESLRAGRA